MRASVAVVVAGIALTGGAAIAQNPGFSRAVLQDQPLRAQGQHSVMAKAQFEPGAFAGKHTHPGEEIGYCLEGTIELIVDGRDTVTLAPGSVFFIPANTPHNGHNVGTTKAALLSTFIVEQGKPLSSPAQ